MSSKEEEAGCEPCAGDRPPIANAIVREGESQGTCAVRIKATFARKLMKCPLFPGNIRMSSKEEKAGCTAMCRRQAADSQCSRPGRRVTGDVCSKEKVDFCQETYEMPIVSWKHSPELEGRGGGVHSHVQTTGRR